MAYLSSRWANFVQLAWQIMPPANKLPISDLLGNLPRLYGKSQKTFVPQSFLAGPVRFELTMGFPTPVFKTGAFNRSATDPCGAESYHKEAKNYPSESIRNY